MKQLIIIGARGYGRVTYCLAKRCIEAGLKLEIKGFLDDNASALDGYKDYAPVLGSVEKYIPEKDDVFICALGNPKYKEKYVKIVKEKGGQFMTLIDPSAVVEKNTEIGIGCIVMHDVHVGQDVHIGDYVTLDGRSLVSHDDRIGDYCHIGATAFLAGNVQVGRGVTVHPGSYIIPKRKIGEEAIIGVGSIVVSNVKPYTTVFGNPAKIIEC